MDFKANIIVIVLLITCIHWIHVAVAQNEPPSLCPPQALILPCRCAQKTNEIQVWCSHSDLPRVLNGIKSVAKFIEKPIDELILENNQLPSLPSRFFSPLRIVRLMLRNNGVERLATGWLNDLESSLVEIFIVERALRSLPFDSLIECKKLQAVTIQSEHLKRAPSFGGLFDLRYIKIEGNELMELPPYGFVDLHALENVYINSSPKLNRLEAGLFQNLDQLKTLNVNGNGISWIHLRAMTNLPATNTIDLSGNEISDAGMVGRAVKDLPKLEILRLDHNFITTLAEGSFVDLESLKELYLNDNAIAEIHHGAFHKTPQLKLLHLENNFLRRVHPESFLQISGSGVEYLHLQYNEIANIEEVKSLLDALPMLKFLDLSYNKLEVVPFGALRGHGSLEQLCLDHNYINRIERDAFMAMPGLRELRLKNNSLSENTPLPFWNLPGLKGLDLSENKFMMLNDSLLIGLPSLRRLDLSKNHLSIIDPNSFSNNLFLETINVSMNELSQIHPATFRFLNRLFEIDASYNRLEELLPGLPRIVERVNVEANKIASLPNTANKLFELPNLRMLNLGGNFLHKIPKNSFKTLYQLRSLSLAQNRLRTIDEHSFAGLTRLEMLNLQDNGIIALHERSFLPLNDLRELIVQGNRLEILIDSISENVQLEKFDASRNNIMEISINTFANSRMLQSLDLSHNALKQLPESLATLHELRDVDISFNRLTNLPSEIITAWRKIEELRASNNKVTELPQNTFTDLPALQYLDLSSNELKIVNSGSIKNLPALQELVLADNQLVELGERSFEDLPSLQALHLQNNFLRYISPKSFHHTNSIVYLNLSMNSFDNMEHVGLRSVRNLEVLDLSGNKVRRISTNPLRNLDWLVELKLDNNHICKVQGEPFSSMPRLKVLTMKNNRMVTVTEPTFRHLRGNLAVLDLDGNPLDCSCSMLWLRAWYQETNSYPGPRCKDGNLLTELRFSKSECDTSTDTRMNQVLLTNEHGDVFKRQISVDECDSDQYNENENIPASPVESEYFYEQYIDYPLNETTYDQAVAAVGGDARPSQSNQSPFSRNGSNIRNDTLLNYNQYKLQQLHHNQQANGGSSPFTFFGMPLPSLGSLWSGAGTNNVRKSNSRADIDANGKSRLRHFRPRPGEIVDVFQFSKNAHPTAAQPPLRDNAEPINISPPPPPLPSFPINGAAINQFTNYPFENKDRPYGTYYQTPYSDPNIEKGGFVPMLPGRKGFTPIQNPYASNAANDSDTNIDDDTQETVSTELKPNVNLEFDENYNDEANDNKFTVLVPTIATQTVTKEPQSRFNVSSLKKGEVIASATISTGNISRIQSTTVRTTSIATKPPVQVSSTTKPSIIQQQQHEPTQKYIQKINNKNESTQTTTMQSSSPPTPPPPLSSIEKTTFDQSTPYVPTFMPNSSDVINLSKNKLPINSSANTNSMTNRNALSALVAPGAQQGIFRAPPGRSIITKVFNNATNSMPMATAFAPTSIQTSTTAKAPVAPKLPTAEEYLRTTLLDGTAKDNTTPSSINRSNTNKQQSNNNIDGRLTNKNDMDWYYNNYNKSTWKEPQSDPGLNRFRSSGSSCLCIENNKTHFLTIAATLMLATINVLA